MKKLTVIAMMACLAMFAVSCKNQPKAVEAEPVATEECTKCDECAGECKDGECKGDCCKDKAAEATEAAQTVVEEVK